MKKFAKRLLSVVLSVLIAMSVMPTAFASTTESPWKFSATEVLKGEEFTMTMEMPETILASSLGFKVVFDNTVFEITNIANAKYTDMQPNLAGCNKNANVMISWCDPTFDANTTINEGEILLEVTFKAKEDAVLGESTFTCEDWNVLGAFSYDTYEMEVITPMPEIMGSSAVVNVVNEKTPVTPDEPVEPEVPAGPWAFTATEVLRGEEFTMTMNMPEDVHASSLGFKVVFDNSVFEIIEIPTTPWSDMQPNMAGCNKNANVMISWCDPTFDANTDIPAGENLLTVKFVAKEDAVLGASTFTCEDWNVLGAFSDETYEMEVITPMPEIMGSSTVVNVVEAKTEEPSEEPSEEPVETYGWEFTANEGEAGDTFVMTMEMPEDVHASSLGFKVVFDNTVFEITEIATTPWSDMQPNLAGCNKNANVMISWCDPTFDANTDIPAGEDLLTVTFKVKDDAKPGVSTFTCEDWNVLGAFSEETFEMEVITPMPEIMGSTFDFTVGGEVEEPSVETAEVPVITLDKAEATIVDGEVATFTASATGNGDLTYAWYKDDVEINNLATLEATEAGTYKVVVTNTLNGTTATAEATVTVTVLAKATAPVVTVEDATIYEGETGTLTATASGNGELSYVWYKDGAVVGDVASIKVSEAGTYTVEVTNALNGTTAKASATATVTVLAKATAPVLTVPSSVTMYEGNVETITVLATANGALTYTWYNEAGEEIGNEASIEVSEAGAYKVVVKNSLNETTASAEAIVEVTVLENATVPTVTVADVTILAGDKGVLEAVVENANGEVDYEWRFNGEVVGDAATLVVTEAGEYTVKVTNTLYEKVEEASATAVVTVLDRADAPVITAEPEDATIFDDEEATLEVVAEANGALSYQWYKDGVAIEGATEATYVTAEAGEYYAVVTNELNGTTATTETVKVTVVVLEHADVPVITDEPEDAYILEGETATLAVEAVANGELAYQWYKDGVAIEGATEATYETAEAGEYYAVVTNTLNGETTETETVKVTVTVTEVIPFFAPELTFADRTMSLVLNSATTAKVGYAFIGNAEFDAECPDWDTFVALGKEYADINGAAGYVVTSDFTERTFKTAGKYAAFVKYTDFDGVTHADYYVFEVVAPEFTAPEFTYADRVLTLVPNDAASAKVGVAFIGDATFAVGTDAWEKFVELGMAKADVNGAAGYVEYADFTEKVFKTAGNYVAFVKYPNGVGTSETAYFTFEVIAPDFTAPAFAVEGRTLSIVNNDAASVKVGVAYIGDATFAVGTDGWDKFVELGMAEADFNGAAGYATYANFTSKTFRTAGNYVAFAKYENAVGTTVTDYYAFEIVVTPVAAPVLTFEDNKFALNTGDVTSWRMGVAFIGNSDFDVTCPDWDAFVALGKQYANMNGNGGYVTYVNDCPTKTYKTAGNYVAFVKYANALGDTVVDYYIFNIPAFGAPELVFEDNTLTLVTNEAQPPVKVGVAYIGDQTFEVGVDNWNEFVAMGGEYTELNGASGYVVSSAFTSKTYRTIGNYVAFVKYANNYGTTMSNYMTFTVA